MIKGLIAKMAVRQVSNMVVWLRVYCEGWTYLNLFVQRNFFIFKFQNRGYGGAGYGGGYNTGYQGYNAGAYGYPGAYAYPGYSGYY